MSLDMRNVWLLAAIMAAVYAQNFEKVTPITEGMVSTTPEPPKNATYWITLPSRIRPGQPIKMTCSVLIGTDPVTVTLSLTNYDGTKTLLLSTPTAVYPGVVKEISVDVPYNLPKPSEENEWLNQYKVIVTGEGNAVNFKSENYLNLEQKAFSIFIQTDKAMYKPGQTVSFRILAVTPDLKVIRNETKDVIIKDAKGNRIRQWLNLVDSSAGGVDQLSLKLADITPTGDWEISVTMKGIEEKKTFTVDNYVLPTYEVQIQTKSFGVTYDPTLPITIKATYTFGQPVTQAAVLVTIAASYVYEPLTPAINLTGKLNAKGEATFELSTKQLLDLTKSSHYSPASLDWQTFKIVANVTEDSTGRVQSATASVQYYNSPVSAQFLEISPSSFKPGLLYTGYLEVKKRDGALLSTEEAKQVKVFFNVTYEVKLTKEELDEKYNRSTSTESPDNTTSDAAAKFVGRPYIPYYSETKTKILTLSDPLRALPETGWITLTFNVPEEAASVNIEAQLQQPFTDQSYRYLSKAGSPSNSYLQLQVATGKPKVGDQITVTAEATELIKNLNYQVYSKGKLVTSGVADSASPDGSKVITFQFTVTQEMAPKLNLIVFYLRKDNSEFVADEISLSVDGLFQKKVNIRFSKEKVEPGEDVDLIVEGEPNSIVYLNVKDLKVDLLKSGNDITQDRVQEDMAGYDGGNFFGYWRYMFMCGWPSRSSGTDAASVFQEANVIMITDGLVYEKPFGGRFPVMYMAAAAPAPEKTASQSSFQPAKNVRKFFPENWIWDSLIASPNGQVKMSLKSPDTITSWVATVFSTHEQYGLSVANSSAKLTTFRNMFISVDLPVSIVRNEDICITVTVFCYAPGETPVLLTLEKSNSFSNIHVTRDGDQIILSKQSINYSYFMGYLSQNDAASMKYCLTPLVIGEVPLKFSALTNIDGLSDAVELNLTVKPEGVPRSTSYSHLVDLSKGSWDMNFPIAYPTSSVTDSQRITVNLAGNFLGSLASDVGNLLKMPYGCGEQNMLNFAPNIYLLQFYYKINRITDEFLKRATDFMLAGYQKEIMYEHGSTGGFSTFGSSGGNPPSTWLTAFVLRSFSQAYSLNLEYGNIISIDKDIVNRSAQWMLTQQNKNGSFTEYGKVFHKEMQGGSAEGESLTAYCVIALFEASKVLDVVDKTKIESGIGNAVTFLTNQLDTVTDPYTICLLAYTFHLVDSPSKQKSFDKMQAIAISGDGLKYWKRAEVKQPDNVYFWSASADSISIEATAYALLTYAIRGIGATEGIPIVRWMTSKKGPNGGFVSTQDTVTGLQALSSIGSVLYTGEDIPMTITISYTNGAGQLQSEVLEVNKNNEMLLQSVNINYMNDAPKSISINARTNNNQRGSSMVMAEVVLTYNVKEDTVAQNYGMSHEIVTKGNNFQIIAKIWTISESAGMSILEVEIPAGYITDLDVLIGNPVISLAEVKEDKLVCYFDTDVITTKGVTVAVNMIASNAILTKALPKSLRIYDFYNPGKELTQKYTLKSEDFCTKAPDVGICQFQ
ncbi:CD109 antigen-like isoform X2 [Physella acuta]|uniref:CD109 antigen-like isoform X2 n=1 Tax=Physella acuta TaxID=109671 RepID=UPI0027DCE1B7|nr:CD109 antigen-like isoform X2 [Physella acuta]